MDFDAQTALSYAASIARPRRVGSGEDERVANEIEDRLRGWGYQVDRQPFAFSTAPQVFLKLDVFAGLLLVCTMVVTYRRSPAVTDAAALLLVALIVTFMSLNRVVQSLALEKNGRWLKWGRRYAAANLSATLPESTSLRGAPNLYLVAHYDSKSQRMPLAVRVSLFTLAIVFGSILVALTFLDVAPAFYYSIGLLAIVAGLPLLFLDVGNHSPGAIDNASSVGLILHLAEVLAQVPAPSSGSSCPRVTLLIPSAEEMTLMGSVAYVTAHERSLHEQAQRGGLYILNFDGVGVDGDLFIVGNSPNPPNDEQMSLLMHVRHACADLHLPLKKFRFAGALFDHMLFAQHGFDAISLVAIGEASRAVHTPQDSIDRLRERGFAQAGQVALRVIEQLTRSNA